MLSASISPNTLLTYQTAVKAYHSFINEFQMETSWPITIAQAISFIAYCFEKGLAPRTINTYVSGLNHIQQLNNWGDFRQNFVIKKMLEGCLRLRKRSDGRLPITRVILARICTVLPTICYDAYETKVFKAAFLLAYFGLFRVSELVVPSLLYTEWSVQKKDISLSDDGKYIFVTLRHSKTNQAGQPITLKIPPEVNSILCPVQAVREFLQVRPAGQGPVFCHANATPVTRAQFSAVLAKSLKVILPNCSNIKSHSFRIGRATELASLGFSSDHIQKMGRWSSNCFRTYIRN